MRNLIEFAKIHNFSTEESIVVDDDGNVARDEENDLDWDALLAKLDDGSDDFEGGDGYRPDGSHDGLGEFEGELEDEEFDGPQEYDNVDPEMAGEFGDGVDPTGEAEDVYADEFAGGEDSEAEIGMGGFEDGEEIDPDFEGIIRTVTGACLVYKRKTEEGTYEELWIYNVGKNMREETRIRRAILAGTDIPSHDIASDDGSQEIKTVTIGNVQYLKVTGLPN